MWKHLPLTFGLAALAACGPPSSRYRDELGRYDRAFAERARVDDDGAELFADATSLSADELVATALARNPNIDSARHAWRAALERYPQATTFEDPMLSYSFAPLSIGSDDVDYGQVVELSVPLPYPGKRRLRGQVVLAEADAARHDIDAVRLRVALMATHLYYELYAVDRSIAIHAEFANELEQHREVLTAHLAAGHAWQDDALKVDIELGQIEQRQIDLAAERDIVAAQINELLHRAPALPLPPLPEGLAAPRPVAEATAELQAAALQRRPELRSAGARRDAEAARVDVADRDFYPDFRVMGGYNSMWGQLEHELMVGIGVTIPIWRGRRHAAVREAEALRARADADVELVRDRVRTEVDRAARAYAASLGVIDKLRDEIVPSAQARVEAIRVGLDSGRTTFIEVLRADHDLLTVRLAYEHALANAHRRHADLELAVGRIAASDATGESR